MARGRRARFARSTIRVRLTVFYGVVFALCGVLLIVVSYLLVRESLVRDERNATTRVADSFGYQQQNLKFLNEFPIPPPPSGREAHNVGDVIALVQGDIRDDALHALVVGSGFAVAGMVVLAIGVGWIASGRALRPVGRLTAHARRISEDNLNERLALRGPDDELKELADTIDGMLARLEASWVAQRRFASNVSHELRTPLSVMRAEADLVLQAADASPRELHLARSVTESTGRAEALLESLLTLARSDSTMRDRASVDLAELTGDIVSERLDAADAAGVHVDLELGSAIVRGDRGLLEGLVINVVDNGINHNEAGGWLRVCVDTEGDDVVVAVTNSGEVLSNEQVAEILQPFRRAGTRSRPGYGLGMTIIQSVAAAHGGVLMVAPRDEGGLEVAVRLPVEHRAEAKVSAMPSVSVVDYPITAGPPAGTRAPEARVAGTPAAETQPSSAPIENALCGRQGPPSSEGSAR